MGNETSTFININIDRQDSYFYGGDFVSGTIELYVKDEIIRANELGLQLIGEMGDFTGTYQHILFLKQNYVLFYQKSNEKMLTYNQDQYAWPFQIQLPNDYPPSTLGDVETYPHVRYYLQGFIDQRSFKPQILPKQCLDIFPRVNLSKIRSCCIPVQFGVENRKDILIKGNLNKCGFIPGESIQGIIEIDNFQCVLIDQIVISLIQYYEIGRSTSQYLVCKKIISAIDIPSVEQIVHSFDMTIPDRPLAPTFQFCLEFEKSAVANVIYKLRITVKSDALSSNVQLMIPINIGTDFNIPTPIDQTISKSASLEDIFLET
ncbi:hypothetical protein I4U23_003530 [Adineta vaga]|nr:hypothetical protein I4U23_003530 [Adineta vaga]